MSDDSRWGDAKGLGIWRPDGSRRCTGPGTNGPEACVDCGYVRIPLPEWAVVGAVFALEGEVYRIAYANCSSNEAPTYPHFHNYVAVTLVLEEPPALPTAPASRSAVADALKSIFAIKKFRADELEKAIRRV